MSINEYPKPPKFADKLLAWFCKNDLFEAIQGDLYEYYERLEGPAWKNKLKYWYQVFNFLRPFAVKNLIIFHNYFIIMTRSNLTLSFRNIKKNLLFSLINIFGLGIALASCILISQYLVNEWDYDKFHPDYEHTFRVTNTVDTKENPISSATTFSHAASELKSSYPAINAVCRAYKFKGSIMVDYKGEAFREENVMAVDSSFFSLFNFGFIYGNKETAFQKGRSVIITKRIAEKYFGDKNPIGEQLVIDGAFGIYTSQGYVSKYSYEVSGVLQDLPKNTHMDFDFLITFNFYSNIEGELKNWGDAFYTYFRVDDLSAASVISDGLPAIVEKYRPGQDMKLGLQPMQAIHLTSDTVDEMKKNGSEKVTWLLAVIALIILGIAGTNYINFTLAKSFTRQREIEIRKVFWAKKTHLIYQFLIEALVINTLSLLLGLLIIWGLTPVLSALLDFDPLLHLTSIRVLAICGGALVLATLLSGLYPALYLSGIKLSRIIASGPGSSQVGFKGRNYLIAFQYTVSILVIGCAIILLQQMKFIQNKDLGMDINGKLVINGATFNQVNDSVYNSKLAIFKSEVLRLNTVEQVTLANFIPGKNIRGLADGYVRKIGDPETGAKAYYFTQVDYDFIPNFGFNLLAGRNFDPSVKTDRRSVIINSEACRLLGFNSPEEALGQKIVYRLQSTPT
ncbi:MAG: ABC transporter permease, partial [Bacteroidota bacterium]